MSENKSLPAASQVRPGAIVLGTGLAFASLILVPAFAARLGVGGALTGAMRIALMRASSRAVAGSKDSGETVPVCCCH